MSEYNDDYYAWNKQWATKLRSMQPDNRDWQHLPPSWRWQPAAMDARQRSPSCRAPGKASIVERLATETLRIQAASNILGTRHSALLSDDLMIDSVRNEKRTRHVAEK